MVNKHFSVQLKMGRIGNMEKKKSEENVFVGFLCGVLIFACFVGFCMFMFWLTMQCSGTKL